jgi:uncharacterized membrane protein YjgN (DUF898 family)
MTVVDHAGDAAMLPPPPPPAPVRLRFTGSESDYWRLMIRGAMLEGITLGIYRFWLYTDMRRFLWAATRVAGDTPDYTGTAAELLIGFLVAIGILVPIYAALFFLSLELGFSTQAGPLIAFLVLAVFGQYAGYRARRYRLTRTVFRGLRFHQTGSAIGYAARATLWWIPIVLTLGLAWPWAAANLERFKMRNTFYGNLGGAFAGSGAMLFRSGLLIWLFTVGPVAAGLIWSLATIDWPMVTDLLRPGRNFRDAAVVLASERSIQAAIGVLFACAFWGAFIGFFLYPAYQAIVMRWWLGGLRLGGAAVASDLRIGRYYETYLLYLAYLMLLSLAFFTVLAVVGGLGVLVLSGFHLDVARSVPLQGAAIASAVVVYVIYALATYAIYQVVVKMRLWRAALESMVITGYTAFDHVHADPAVSSAVGEGLADALGSGGI